MKPMLVDSAVRSRARLVLSTCGFVFGVVGCGGSPPKLGTLPVVQVELPEDPEGQREATPIPPPPPPATEEVVVGDAPDPEARRTAEQLDLEIVFERGDVRLLGAARRTLDSPEVTPRRLGRFAIELFRGAELIERVRFDFPLLGDAREQSELERGLTTRVTVRVPDLAEATRAQILDRKTRRTVALPWPLAGSRAEDPAEAAETRAD